MAVGVERKFPVLFLGVEPEQAIELLGLGHVGHDEVEMVERMHAELAGTALSRLGHGADLGHGEIPLLDPKYAFARARANPPAQRLPVTNRRSSGNTCQPKRSAIKPQRPLGAFNMT